MWSKVYHKRTQFLMVYTILSSCIFSNANAQVSIMGHSLGGMLAFDLLCHQPTEDDIVREHVTMNASYVIETSKKVQYIYVEKSESDVSNTITYDPFIQLSYA